MKHVLWTVLVLSLFITACNRGAHHEVAALAKEDIADGKTIPATDSASVSGDNALINTGQKIIKEATLTLEVKDQSVYSKSAEGLIKKYQGYISKEEREANDDQDQTNVMIKVPVQYFDSLLNELHSADTKQLERSITSEDAGGEMTDIAGRLEAKKQAMAKYMEFLKQAKNTNDILQIQKEINSIQEELDAAVTRLEYLSKQTRYSTIHLTYFEPGKGLGSTEKPGYAIRLSRAFSNGISAFADILIVILSVWPIWIIVLIVIVAMRRSNRKGMFQKKQVGGI